MGSDDDSDVFERLAVVERDRQVPHFLNRNASSPPCTPPCDRCAALRGCRNQLTVAVLPKKQEVAPRVGRRFWRRALLFRPPVRNARNFPVVTPVPGTV